MASELIKPVLPSEEERFSANTVGLSQLVFDIVSKAYQQGYKVVNPQLVEFASFMIGQFDKTVLISGFATYSHEHWPLIHKRNKIFFVDYAHVIFQDLPTSNVDAFKQLFTLTNPQGDSIVDKEDSDALWDFFATMVKICIKYIHNKRKPQSFKIEAGMTHKYTVAFMPEVDIAMHAKMWGMTLEFPPSSS